MKIETFPQSSTAWPHPSLEKSFHRTQDLCQIPLNLNEFYLKCLSPEITRLTNVKHKMQIGCLLIYYDPNVASCAPWGLFVYYMNM